MFDIGQKVEIGFNEMPAEERARLVSARSTGRNTTTIYESRVDQICHQKTPEMGEIVEILQNRSKYLVRVFVENSPRGRLRQYASDSHLLKAV